MESAYVDASAILSIAFHEPGYDDIDQRLRGFSRLLSSNFLEAEIRSAFAREGRVYSANLVPRINWIYPNRPLSAEIASVLRVGYLRGADLWHVAVALYHADDPEEMSFVTLDNRQRTVASALGFQT